MELAYLRGLITLTLIVAIQIDPRITHGCVLQLIIRTPIQFFLAIAIALAWYLYRLVIQREKKEENKTG
jgi:hypothetical protein